MSQQALDYDGSTPFRQAAGALWRAGWANPLPIGNGKSLPPAGYTGYDGRSVSWPDLQAWLEDDSTPPNVGIRLQQTVVGIDVDAYDDKRGAVTIRSAEETLGDLPPTYTSTSRGADQPSRIHFFKVPLSTSLKGAERRFVEAFGPDVEIIHFGHRYAVVAPSVHPRTGATYCWYDKNGEPLKDVPPMDAIPDLPQPWLAVFITPSETVAQHPDGEARRFTRMEADVWVDRYAIKKLRNAKNGEINVRINEAGAVLSHFVPLFYSQKEAERMIWAARAETVADEATEDRDRGSMRSGLSTEGWKAVEQVEADGELTGLNFFTDVILGPEFAKERLIGKYKFASKMWLKWDGRRWAECTEDVVLEVCRDWIDWRTQMAIKKMRNSPPRPDGKNLVDCWRPFSKMDRVRAIVRFGRGNPAVAANLADFDRNRDVLNTESGIVDLRTGKLSPSDPKAMCMKLAPVRYVAGAESKVWAQALEAVPDDCLEWFQMFMGQAITGYEPTEDRLLVMQGSGENGKTLVLSLGIRNVMGDYYTVLDDKVLLGEQGSGPSPELMALRGARIAVLEETQEARHLDTQRLKKVVGTGVLTGRYLFKDTVTWDTSHTMIINTNYLPRVKENDRGTWRRLMTLPFPYTYVKGDRDLQEGQRIGDVKLKSKLGTDEAKEAILAWLIEGAKLWYQNERQMDDEPERIEAATTKWRAENDVVLSFLQAGIVEPDIKSHVMSTDLLSQVNNYLREMGAHEWTDRLLADRFGNHPSMVNAHVEKKRVRANSPSAGPLSRPRQAFGLPQVTGVYPAWIGLRFTV